MAAQLITLAEQYLFGSQLLTTTVQKVCDIAVKQAFTDHPNLVAELEKLDIVCQLQMTEAIVQKVTEKAYTSDPAVKISVDNINILVEKIHVTMIDIENESMIHQEKWLSGWRAPNFQPYISKLTTYKGILNERRDVLMNILSLNKKFSPQPKKLEMMTPE
eukprot:TRINITY_DN13250_c0_g1_i1.p1 TRINITY_DN13250_c0_g1~~TRINITY_DN13250_c0_g1_i1.p1  ORF type:complete len:175 (+),score=29.75 TRINITY_DN13250_c0_g1_i1:43-525(+)